MPTSPQHAAAQLDQVAQHFALLVGELQAEIASAATRAETGVAAPAGTQTVAARIAELASDWGSFRAQLARHTAALRSLAA